MDDEQKRTQRMEEGIEAIFHRLINRACRCWPRPTPPTYLLDACRLISHRGEHDNRRRMENTLAAFDAADAAGVWGIEMDLRWTRDLIPVVIHDPDTRRMFGECAQIGRMPLDTLKKRFPLIPTLAEVIDRYGGRLHLMLEIKAEPYPRPPVQSRRLSKLFRHLSPGQNFHFMSLHPVLFNHFGWLPASTFVPIARIRADRASRMAARHRWGGLAGHFLSMTNGLLTRHHGLGQGIGTGFADSRRCLYREVARGVDWIFSNRAADMQAVVNGRINEG
ncbi:MAG: glycerophosphodiester phosphodiesterase family protein [Desulfosarcina sp.]